MLRLAVIVLLLANAGYFAWSQGHLRPWGWAPQEQAEPQRMNQQIRPETLQILKVNASKSSSSAPAAASTASAPSASANTPLPPTDTAECLQAGVFDERQAEALRGAAADLPPGSWLLEPVPVPGRWMVYMGRFDDADTLDKKRAELRARKVEFDRAGGALEPGLSLGRFSSEEAARREMGHLANKGVRTARVVQERADATGFMLRLPAVNSALRAQLDALRPAMAGKTLRSCG